MKNIPNKTHSEKRFQIYYSNYRVISIRLSVLIKVMTNYSDQKYNLRQMRFTVDIIFYVTHSLQNSFELHGVAQVVALDISEAFNKVWYTPFPIL